jgi:hypothetical protein
MSKIGHKKQQAATSIVKWYNFCVADINSLVLSSKSLKSLMVDQLYWYNILNSNLLN